MKIQAAVCRDASRPPGIETLHLDTPRPDEVLVRILACGVCHTDLFAPHRFLLPAVFGHEGAGVVEKVGAAVTKVRPGDRVVLTFGSCGACRRCGAGDVAYCERGHDLQFGGCRPDGSPTMHDANGLAVHGAFFQQSSFASHALATERNVVRIPDELCFEQAAPLGCGIQTGVGAVLNTLRAVSGSSIAVFGTGSVGLSAILGAVLAECETIIAVDIRDNRLDLASELGATHVINGREGDLEARVRAITGGRGVDYSLESAGQTETFKAAIAALARKGHCAMVTVPKLGAPFEWSPLDLLLRAGRLVACIEGDSVPDRFIPQLAAWHLDGKLPYDRFCRNYCFRDIQAAWSDAESGACIKPIICMS
ncbi:MAG: NAD(P)-dependent alcohol dehydrogenase [Steroidobacteraceae bacterium]